MKYINIIYFVFAAFILGFGAVVLIKGIGKPLTDIIILIIGLYFLYRGIAVTVNEKHRREREDQDNGNDPANA